MSDSIDLQTELLRDRLTVLQRVREFDLPDFATVDESDPMALTLVVNTDKLVDERETPSEQDVLVAVVHAVDLALSAEDIEVQQAVNHWCQGRIRKLVKRARASAWAKLAEHPDHIDTAHFNHAAVAVFKPQALSQVAPELRKLQVQGLQFERATEQTAPSHPYLEVQIDESLGMSTGKAAAQVGHAAQLFLMHAPVEQILAWWEAGRPTWINYVEAVKADHEIRDAGFTEVAADSLTAGSTYHA